MNAELVTGDFVEIGDAVNWSAQLNRGLVSWLLTLPGQQRGIYYRDLMARHDGTLSSGTTWHGPRGRPGGFGSSNYSSSWVTLAGSFNDAAYSYAFWAYPTADDTNAYALWENAAGTPNYRSIISAGSAWGASGNSWGTYAGAPVLTLVGSRVLNVWQHVCMTVAGTTATMHVNGLQTAQATGITPGIGGVIELGRYSPAGLYYPGFLDDVRIYNRAISASEVASLVRASSQGYLNELNWIRPLWYVEQAGGAPSSILRQMLAHGLYAGRAA